MNNIEFCKPNDPKKKDEKKALPAPEKPRMKLAEWRGKNPRKNPNYGLYTLKPDAEGREINEVANIAIVEYTLREAYRAQKHYEQDSKNSWAEADAENAKDRLQWAMGIGDWKTGQPEIKKKEEEEKKEPPQTDDGSGMIAG